MIERKVTEKDGTRRVEATTKTEKGKIIKYECLTVKNGKRIKYGGFKV